MFFSKLLALALLVAVASAAAPRKPLQDMEFVAGKIYVYGWEARLLSGAPGLEQQYAGMDVAGRLMLHSESRDVLALKLVDVKLGRTNDKWRHSNYESDDEEMDTPRARAAELSRYLELPIRVLYQGGKVKSFVADTTEPEWSLNMKKAILSLLQVDLVPEQIIKSPLRTGQQVTEQSLRRAIAEGQLTVYPVYEESIGGTCETLYETKTLEKNNNNNQWSVQNESNDDDEDDYFLQVTKTFNFDNCLTEPHMVTDNFDRRGCSKVCRKMKSIPAVDGYYPVPDEVAYPYGTGCPCEKTPQSEAVSRYQWVNYNISNAASQPLIESIRSEGRIIYKLTDEELLVSTRQNLTLEQVLDKEPTKKIIPEINNAITHEELEFRIPQVESQREGVSSPMDIPLYAVYGKADIDELVQVIPKHLDVLASDIISGQTERTKKSMEKAIQMVNALAVLPVRAMEQIYRDIAQTGRQESAPLKEQIMRKLFLDALPLAGTNQAALFIEELVDAEQTTANEAREMIEAIPQNLFLADIKTIKSYIELSLTEKVKSKPALLSATSIAVGKMIKDSCIKARQVPGDLPIGNDIPQQQQQQQQTGAGRQMRSAAWESQFVQDLCTEQDLDKFVQIYKQLLLQPAEFYQTVAYVEALAHMAAPQVLSIMEPIIAGDYTDEVTAKIMSYYAAEQRQTTSRNARNVEKEFNFVRTVFIYALHHLVHDYPKQVEALVLPVYHNKQESYEVRIAAFTVIMAADPHKSQLERIASELHRDEDDQVVNYVTSALKSAGNFSLPCAEKLAYAARATYKHTPETYQNKQEQIDMENSFMWSADYYNKEREFGLWSMASLVQDSNEESETIPKSGYLAVGQSNGPFQDKMFEFGWNQKGMDHIFKSIFDSSMEDTDSSEETSSIMAALKDLKARINIKEQLFGQNQVEDIENEVDPKLAIFFKSFYSTSHFALNGRQIKEYLAQAQDYFRYQADKLFAANRAGGDGSIHYVKLLMPSQFMKVVPSAMGLPVVITQRHPVVLSIKIDQADLKLKPTTKLNGENQEVPAFGFNFTARIQPLVIYSNKAFVFGVDPSDSMAMGVHADRTTVLSFPSRVSVAYKPRDGAVKFQWVPMKNSQQENVYYKSEAKTFIAKTMLAGSPDRDWLENSKSIRSQETPFHTTEILNFDKELTGMNVQVQVAGEKEYCKQPFWMSEIADKEGLIPAAVESMTSMGQGYCEIHADLKADRSHTTYGWDMTLKFKKHSHQAHAHPDLTSSEESVEDSSDEVPSWSKLLNAKTRVAFHQRHQKSIFSAESSEESSEESVDGLEKKIAVPMGTATVQVQPIQAQRRDMNSMNTNQQQQDLLEKEVTLVEMRGANACFSMVPVKKCSHHRATPVGVRKLPVPFHCLPASSAFTQQLVQEAKDRVISELTNKRVDRTEQRDVPRACAPKA